jgi:hypothetical protein
MLAIFSKTSAIDPFVRQEAQIQSGDGAVSLSRPFSQYEALRALASDDGP